MEAEDGFVALIDEKELAEGKMNVVSYEGTPVLFIKQNSKIYVFDNRCPHMACSLSGGTLEESLVICPCHDWRFNLETGEYKEEPAITLVKYDWKVVSGKIYVKL